MPVIDSEGLFEGDRFDLVSDEARLFWPHFWCASNSVGRIELNYRKVCSAAFGRWRKRPAEDKFWALVAEYRDAFLLFVYESEGAVWGAWDTSEKYLPRHKHAADLRSPSPAHDEFISWKNEYASKKNAKSNVPANFVSRAQIGAGPHTNVRGVGVGVGGGVGKPSVAKPATVVDEISDWFIAEFWPLYPRHTAKAEGLKAARAKLKTPADRSAAMKGLRSQVQELRSREESKIPHPATWINGRRWEDEAPQLFRQSTPQPQGPAYQPWVDKFAHLEVSK